MLFVGLETMLRLYAKSKLEVAQAMHATLAVGTQFLLAQKTNLNLIPLAGLSNKLTLLCNEGHGWTNYHSDRYGFPNDDKIWQQKNIHMAFIGDSYFQGACLPQGQSFVDLIKNKVSALNLSSFGHGPLAQLGIVHEYLMDIKPKKVVLSFVPNDLGIDLPLEYRHKILREYLHGKGQNLKQRQFAIDQLYNKFLLNSQNITDQRAHSKVLQNIQRLKLSLFRSAPQNAGYFADYQNINQEALLLYRKILQKIVKLVNTWSGQVYLVYIPDAYSYAPASLANSQLYQAMLATMTKELGIKFISLAKMFNKNDNPFAYYTPLAGHYGHFNGRGTQLARAYLEKKLAIPL